MDDWGARHQWWRPQLVAGDGYEAPLGGDHGTRGITPRMRRRRPVRGGRFHRGIRQQLARHFARVHELVQC